MENLRQWRDSFEEARRIEAKLQKRRTVSEKVSRFLEMRRLWSARLKETEFNYRLEKRHYLADLQERLGKVAKLVPPDMDEASGELTRKESGPISGPLKI